jgi:hypothetical protein
LEGLSFFACCVSLVVAAVGMVTDGLVAGERPDVGACLAILVAAGGQIPVAAAGLLTAGDLEMAPRRCRGGGGSGGLRIGGNSWVVLPAILPVDWSLLGKASSSDPYTFAAFAPSWKGLMLCCKAPEAEAG